MKGLRWVVAMLFPFAFGHAVAQDQGDLQRQLQEQKLRIDELERLMKEKGSGTGAANDKAADDVVHWKELRVGDSTFKLYGFLRLDAIFDDSRPNNTQTVGFILSEDRNAPPGTGAGGKNREDLTIHPRLTRFGIEFDGPTIGGLVDAKVTGKLEIDFYNNGLQGQAESREAIRMRHAWLKMKWDDFSILAGQTNDVISPLFPIVNPDFVMWNAGNLGDRRPQLRLEYAPAIDSSRLILQGEAGLTGADDNQDLDATGAFGSGFRDGETSGLPTWQGRVAYNFPIQEKRSAEIGAYVHYAWEKPDVQIAGKNRFRSAAIGYDANFPLYEDCFWLKSEGWVGENLDDVRGGIFQNINRTTGEEIESKGGFLEFGFKVAPPYSISVGYSTDDPDNSDLGVGGRAANKIFYLANRFSFKPIDFGIDYLHWETEYVGFTEGVDNRIQAFVSYSF